MQTADAQVRSAPRRHWATQALRRAGLGLALLAVTAQLLLAALRTLHEHLEESADQTVALALEPNGSLPEHSSPRHNHHDECKCSFCQILSFLRLANGPDLQIVEAPALQRLDSILPTPVSVHGAGADLVVAVPRGPPISL